MILSRRVVPLLLFAIFLATAPLALGQADSASLSGLITDPKGNVVPGVAIVVTNIETNINISATTNNAGLYVVTPLKPGHYRVSYSKPGFRRIDITDLVLNVQDALSRNLQLQIGSAETSITVSASAATINTENASVGTVIDRQFVNNLPMNGRSYQTLIAMVPGVIIAPVSADGGEQGQFSANGQRQNGNYFTVDGVAANFGIQVYQGMTQGSSGSLPATNIQGGFSNLVTVDDLQEFRIQTSTFAPEFGRTPGAQISLVTRSGQNRFHGSAFDYLRNDAADAMDYFDTTKTPLRFNDFGGSFSGPIWRNKTFFFASYEGQRFMLPQQPVDATVPSLESRAGATNDIAKQLLNAFPLPNGGPSGNGGAIYHTSYSLPNNMDAFSLRIDHNFNGKYSVFGRYNHAPSNSKSRSVSNMSSGSDMVQNTDTLTLGSTQVLTPTLVNEIRLNGSRQVGKTSQYFDGFGGGVEPDASIFLPKGYKDSGNREYIYTILTMSGVDGNASLNMGDQAKNQGRSINLVDNLSYILGKHALKFGYDQRWYSPVLPGNSLVVVNNFLDVGQVYSLTPFMLQASQTANTVLVTDNYSLYAQDTWTVNPRFTLTYGLRWEINPAPHTKGSGQALFTLKRAPDLSKLDQNDLELARAGTPYYPTSYGQVAPRIGIAYQINRNPGHELVLRGGWGLFYDLASTPFRSGSWPYTTTLNLFPTGPVLPVTSSSFNFPEFNTTPSETNRVSGVSVAAKGFTAPRAHQWNLSLEQSFGSSQSLSVSYVGSAGRNLLRTMNVYMNPTNATPDMYYSQNFSSIDVVGNDSSSDYNSLQVQFNRRLARGLQGLVNYTWSHSTDDNSGTQSANAPGFVYSPKINHGASNFDVRHNFSAALTYDVPTLRVHPIMEKALRNWSLSSTFFARTGLPYDIQMHELNSFNYYQAIRRVDVVPGVPLTVHDPTVPGGIRINTQLGADGNPVAFRAPTGTATQGTLQRNSLYGFGMWQVDMGLRRTFHVSEKLKAEFRVEAFNLFNHPNFTNPYSQVDYDSESGMFTLSPEFGVSPNSLSHGYGGGGFTGGFNPLFQMGGPRSMQAALRLTF